LLFVLSFFLSLFAIVDRLQERIRPHDPKMGFLLPIGIGASWKGVATFQFLYITQLHQK